MTEKWTADPDGQPQYSSPAVGSEHVYVGGLSSTVTALSPDSGDKAWTVDRDGSLSDSSPTVADGTVYIGSGGGSLSALAESDGSVEWTHSTDSALVSSPTVSRSSSFSLSATSIANSGGAAST